MSPSSSPTPGHARKRLRVEAIGLTDRGLSRSHNQDAFAVCHDLGLLVVADGMGGAAAGEVGARLAVATLRAALSQGAAPSVGSLAAGIEQANANVHAAAREDRAKEGMGTTLAALLVLPHGVAVAHVGDSRVYRMRRGRLHPLTEDHTLVDEQVRAGQMTRAEARRSRFRHLLSRAIGTRESVTVERRVFEVEPGDVFLLATDGLHGVVEDDDIAAILNAHTDLGRAATYLIDAAYDRHAPDNVTVLLARVEADARAGAVPRPDFGKNTRPEMKTQSSTQSIE